VLNENIDWKKVEAAATEHAWALAEKKAEMDREFYGKLAEWGERLALALLVSLVIQQLVNGQSVMAAILALIPTAAAYTASFFWLKKSKTL
jgi:hypothetical protein